MAAETEIKIVDKPVDANGNSHTAAIREEQPALPRERQRRKRWVLLAVLAILLVAGLFFGLPRLSYMMSHVSTDDATVNSHVTYLSSRIAGVAEQVLVDDNQYVEQGAPLVRLDAEPYRIAV